MGLLVRVRKDGGDGEGEGGMGRVRGGEVRGKGREGDGEEGEGGGMGRRTCFEEVGGAIFRCVDWIGWGEVWCVVCEVM